jgi:integrase
VNTTYDVRIWKTYTYKGTTGNTYHVRWGVAGQPFKEPFKSKALADGFKADLVRAARKGEAFDMVTGLPVSMKRTTNDTSWYSFACAYVDMKWPNSAATTRRTVAEVMTAITVAMALDGRSRPEDQAIRSALTRWGFNTNLRDDAPEEAAQVLAWLRKNTRNVSTLESPDAVRALLQRLSLRLDGRPAAASVVGRRREVLNTALEYAIERKILHTNPVTPLKWKTPKAVRAVDRRSVANPVQARTLLEAVRTQQRTGPRLVAFFGCLYFAGLRPEEAVSLTRDNLEISESGWGELHLNRAEPHAGKEWTDSGAMRDRRQLKHRDVGHVRSVPCPPELTTLLQDHLREFGTAPDGRLFRGERNASELPKLTIIKAWNRARAIVFTPEVWASPLAATPYDLRHAALSTWLNAGIPPADVAAWAGHSIDVLLKIYAKCLDGGTQQLRRRMDRALGRDQT